MAVVSPPRSTLRRSERQPPRRRRKRALWVLGGALLVLLGFAALVFYWSGATLAADSTALAKVKAQPFAGTVESVQVRGPDGQPIPVS
ncbi:MAG TPA: hypothetical protein VEH52_11255, partial [Gaiellaceae bacterium]|nr:hypothetical protein [Gaiellaceae bacterium]